MVMMLSKPIKKRVIKIPLQIGEIMSISRPEIPEPIKRIVRQQCYFGCAICGMPFFEYDHIEEYAHVKENKADNLILLCPTHHAAKTTNKMSKERLKEAQKNPYNASRPNTTGFKVEPSKQLITLLGSNKVTGWYPDGKGDHYPIWINGKGFFVIHSNEGWLSVSLTITNEHGDILLQVIRGELIVSTSSWDYVYESDNIKIRAGLRNILLDMTLSDCKVQILNGMFFDKTKDGFIVRDGALITYCDGNFRGFSTGCTSHCNGNGGWGLLNKNKFPSIPLPMGFGFFTSN